MKKSGPCQICGVVGPLSFEHVPPEAAFNDRRVLLAKNDEMLAALQAHGRVDVSQLKTKVQQRGAGEYTLCERCNSTTGSWYGTDYVRFVEALAPLAHQTRGFGSWRASLTCRPHSVLKQMLAMFCSASPGLVAGYPNIPRYLLNRDAKALPPNIGIHLAIMDWGRSTTSRRSALTGRIDISGASVVYAEIAYFPFVIVMTIDSPSPDALMFDITWFKRYEVHEEAIVTIDLFPLIVSSYIPGVYGRGSGP